MEKIKRLILPTIIINLLIVNVAVIYLAFFKKSEAASTLPATTSPQTSQTIYQDKCGVECQKFITEQLSLYSLPTPKPTLKPAVVTIPTPTKTTRVSYVPVPGSGTTTANDWADISGTDFYFNPADYPGLQSVYFETNMRLVNGNGEAYVRLFDVTHGIGVVQSETHTSSQTSTAVGSGLITFWQGNNLYRVQAKSLTADTTVFDSGRLKVTTKN